MQRQFPWVQRQVGVKCYYIYIDAMTITSPSFSGNISVYLSPGYIFDHVIKDRALRVLRRRSPATPLHTVTHDRFDCAIRYWVPPLGTVSTLLHSFCQHSFSCHWRQLRSFHLYSKRNWRSCHYFAQLFGLHSCSPFGLSQFTFQFFISYIYLEQMMWMLWMNISSDNISGCYIFCSRCEASNRIVYRCIITGEK